MKYVGVLWEWREVGEQCVPGEIRKEVDENWCKVLTWTIEGKALQAEGLTSA
jgi:hypothetical protein